MNVKIKKLSENAVIPSYAHDGDCGMDIIATRKWIDDYGNICYGTDLAFEIPEGYAMFIFPRSSVSKYDLSLCNSIGILDSIYRGELIFKFTPALALGNSNECEDPETIEESNVIIPGYNPYVNPSVNYYEFNTYEVGDKIGQIVIMPYPKINFIEVDELSTTERGEGGFGSTGK